MTSHPAQDLGAEYPTIPELDETQLRDWPHRKGIDPPDSWTKLWRFPVAEGSAGAANSGPCMCGRVDCPCRAPSGNCGINVHDPATCWQCKAFFAAQCVAGFDAVLGGTSGPRGADGLQMYAPITIGSAPSSSTIAKLLEWGRCPLCSAPLGASAMPTVFQQMLGAQCSPSDGSRVFEDLFRSEVKAVGIEIDGCGRLMREHAAAAKTDAVKRQRVISLCTRVINACNLLRSMDEGNFTLGVADNYFCAHFTRAKLEGDTRVYRAIREGVRAGTRRWGDTVLNANARRRASFDDDADFASSFVEPRDFAVASYPGGLVELEASPPNSGGLLLFDAPPSPAIHSDGQHLCQMFDQRLRASQPPSPQPWPDHDPKYHQLDAERRGMRMWVQRRSITNPPGSLIVSACMDYRWAFHSVASAKVYFRTHLAGGTPNRTENSEGNPLRCQPTTLRIDGADESLVLASDPSTSPCRPSFLQAWNVLLRVGRVCAKLYINLLQIGADAPEAEQQRLPAAVQRLGARVAQRMRDAQLGDRASDGAQIAELCASMDRLGASWLGDEDNEDNEKNTADEDGTRARRAVQSPSFACGTRVGVHGLTKAAQYNSQNGTVETGEVLASGRIAIVLDGGKRLSVKPENLLVLPPPPTPDPS